MSQSLESLYDLVLKSGWHVHRSIFIEDGKRYFSVASVKNTDHEITLLQNIHYAQENGENFVVGEFGIGDRQAMNYLTAIEYFKNMFKLSDTNAKNI